MKSKVEEFQIFVKPVGSRCNLACDYCYYNHDNQGSSIMSPEILETYIKLHIEYCTDSSILFSWHGGEPLLAGLDFFRLVLSLQQKYNLKGAHIINGIQTNGTLIDNTWARFFSEHGFIIGLSLDGPESYHNQFRKDFSQTDTFSRVMHGWELLKNYGVRHEILCVVNNYSAESPEEIYTFFKENGAESITFIPLLERVGEKGVSERSVNPESWGNFLITCFNSWKSDDIGKVKVQIFEEALRSAFKQEHTLCIFKRTCGGVPAIEANGEFFSCDHYVNDQNRVGSIKTTSLGDLLNSDKQRAFGNNKERLPQFCLLCGVLEMCNGECPKNRFTLTPDGESGLNYLCPGYKKFFTHCKPFVEEVARVWQAK